MLKKLKENQVKVVWENQKVEITVHIRVDDLRAKKGNKLKSMIKLKSAEPKKYQKIKMMDQNQNK